MEKTFKYPTCATCKFWEQKTFYDHENAVNEGKCTELRFDFKLTIEIYGDGGLERIETSSNFGCINHEEKENK